MPADDGSLAILAGVMAGVFAVVLGAFALLRQFIYKKDSNGPDAMRIEVLQKLNSLVASMSDISNRMGVLELWHYKEDPYTGLPRAYFNPKPMLDEIAGVRGEVTAVRNELVGIKAEIKLLNEGKP